jgi:L-methionine (R)-S-oxide reductase
LEQIVITSSEKKDIYQEVLPQIASLVSAETNLIANMANTCAVLKEVFNWWWVGFYLVENEQELVLGPFQGPLACTRIAKGKGVCGAAWLQQQTIIVPNVDLFPGHIACSSASKSEIVLPLVIQGKMVAVLDIDSEKLAHFDADDQYFLEKILSFFDSI